MRLVFLGAPGAGKGTQAQRLIEKYGLAHISTGDMMRAAVAAKSEVGLKVKRYLDSGELVPDQVVLEVVKDRLANSDCEKGFLLDGFPRTVAQAQMLDKMLVEAGRPLTRILNLAVPREVLIDRIQKRGAAGSGRTDDDPKVALHRLEVFLSQTAPVIEYYRASPVFREIDGVGAIEEVASRVARALA